MSKKAIARVGDMTNHGGRIIEGSATVMCDGIPVARVGDKVVCGNPKHGVCTITTGSSTTLDEGKQIATVGSKTSCGAEIILGSPTRFVDT